MEKFKCYSVIIAMVLLVICCKPHRESSSENKDISIKDSESLALQSVDINTLTNEVSDVSEIYGKIKKSIAIFGSYNEDYYLVDKFKLDNYLEIIDSVMYNKNKLSYSLLFNNSDLYTKKDSNKIILPTNYGSVILKIKSEEENPYDIERYEYMGFWNSINAYLLLRSKGEGYAYTIIYKRFDKDFTSSGHPYVSRDKNKCITCRVDAENIVIGTIEFFRFDQENKTPQWGGWSDYTLLPIEAVWESDSTALIKAEQYASENDYYEQKVNGYKYGRITIRE